MPEPTDTGLLRIADRTVAAGHDIHTAMRALAMAMHPHKLFRRAAGRTSRHDMRSLTFHRGRTASSGLIRNIAGFVCHLGPSLSFIRRRAAVVPSWNVPNHTSSGKSTLP